MPLPGLPPANCHAVTATAQISLKVQTSKTANKTFVPGSGRAITASTSPTTTPPIAHIPPPSTTQSVPPSGHITPLTPAAPGIPPTFLPNVSVMVEGGTNHAVYQTDVAARVTDKRAAKRGIVYIAERSPLYGRAIEIQMKSEQRDKPITSPLMPDTKNEN